MGQPCQGVPLALFLLYAREVRLAGRMVPQHQHRGCGGGPLEVGVAELLARSALAFTGGLLGPLHEPPIGDDCLPARAAVDSLHGVEQHEGQALADPGDRAQALEGLRIVGVGGLDERSRQVRAQAVLGGHQRPVDGETLLPRGIGQPLGNASTVGVLGERLPKLGEVGLRVGLLDMGQEVRPLAHA